MQINRAIGSAINDRVLPEIQNMIGNLHADQNGTGTGFGNAWKEPKTKFTKKDSRSACDLRENADFTPYMYGTPSFLPKKTYKNTSLKNSKD